MFENRPPPLRRPGPLVLLEIDEDALAAAGARGARVGRRAAGALRPRFCAHSGGGRGAHLALRPGPDGCLRCCSGRAGRGAAQLLKSCLQSGLAQSPGRASARGAARAVVSGSVGGRKPRGATHPAGSPAGAKKGLFG
ncbi:MAG: hypothetical protein WKG07_15870 [Hymenobacter sp.]